MTASSYVVLALLMLQGTIGVVIAAPEDLGVPKIAAAWLAVALVPIGILLNQLKAIGTPPPPPAPKPESEDAPAMPRFRR